MIVVNAKLATGISCTNPTRWVRFCIVLVHWLLFNANSAIFQLCHGGNKLIFNVLDQPSVGWISIVLAHWNNSPRVDRSLHSDTLFWFGASQSLLFLLNTAYLADKQQLPMLWSLVWPDRGSSPRSIALEVSMLTITPPMRLLSHWNNSLQEDMSFHSDT